MAMAQVANAYRGTADLYSALADVYSASADRERALLADEESWPDSDIFRAGRSGLTEDIDDLIRYANRFRAMADERMAESDRLRVLSYSFGEDDQLGAQIPASESAIMRVLKRVRVDADAKADESEESEEGGQAGDRKRRKVSEKQSCAVCLEEFQEGSEVASMPCSHFFHDKCIATWLKRKPSCPLCRREVVVLD